MISSARLFSFLLVALLVGLSPALRAEHPLLTKARGYLAPESALDAVHALRFTGELELSESGATQNSSRLEIIFKSPYRQRITASRGARTEVTALDGYDAWTRATDAQLPSHSQVTLLGPDQIKRLRANTVENLAFYRGLEAFGARVEDRGLATVDGIACRKFAFIHGSEIVYTRSFDLATGRLVLTETDGGTQIREEGEIRSGGIRFPKTIVTLVTLPDGTTRTVRVNFSEITVNPEVADEAFAVPSLIQEAL
jgi:hypothetical protein